MAHYLHRSFHEDQKVLVLHGLRLVDRAKPEQDGSPGVCQIDHLVVHRFGFFIIESKSVTEEVRVRPDGSDGDEWTRMHRRRETGMPSPIQQARRQGDFLRAYLQRHRQDLVGRQSFGLRTIAKVFHGTDQRGFKYAPIQLVVAVSDQGKIKRLSGWKEPRDPFQAYVTKADLVPDKISKELVRHRKGAKAGNRKKYGDYGIWSMEEPEVEDVARFLAQQHVDRFGISATRPTLAQCRHCGSKDLAARKRYSHYWKCCVCEKNTPMPAECSACGANGKQDKKAQIRQRNGQYFLDCQECGTSALIWTDA